ncbi:MAG: LETM1-like protein-domain-containing protein, partial [Podila humilis]
MYRAVQPSFRTRVGSSIPPYHHHGSLRLTVITPYYHTVRTRDFHAKPALHQHHHPDPHHTFHSSSKPNTPASLALTHDPPIFLKSTTEKLTLASRTELVRQRGANESHQKAGAHATDTSSITKKTLWVRFKNEMVHYWHGTKLLGTEIKISSKLAHRIFHGSKLTRREQKQLRRTTGDLLRLIPFSVFIIVPFMEFLLPVALKLFPDMLPSTFEHSFAADEKKRKLLKMRLEVAKFMQQTIEDS